MASKAARDMSSSSPIRTLALSVHFKNPDFGMHKYEILSRASAFLLNVDPYFNPKDNHPDDKFLPSKSERKYGHLKKSAEERAKRELKRNYAYEPAGGRPGRDPVELGWLEFCPTKFRPVVHCVASSHVLSPWLWQKFYPQEWISHVKPEHCSYSLEVICPTQDTEEPPLETFPLSPYPIHHPQQLDLAIIHLKDEEDALEKLRELNVDMLYLRDFENKEHFRGERVTFEGFEIDEIDRAEAPDGENGPSEISQDGEDEGMGSNLTRSDSENESQEEADKRIFYPYESHGELIYASADRFLASTPKPLPQGLCGGPVFDSDGRVAGVVEGIVPLDHPEKQIAGSAAFIPSVKLREFLDMAEYGMLKKILPSDLFTRVERLKEGKMMNEGEQTIDLTKEAQLHNRSIGNKDDESEPDPEAVYEDFVNKMREHYGPEYSDAVLNTIRSEREQVQEILQKDGGDIDEVIASVRAKTREKQFEIMKNLEQEEAEVKSTKGE